MNRLQVRDACVQHMEDVWAANKAACPVFYKRQHDTISMQNITGDWFIKFTVAYEDAEQANIHPSPFHRTSGNIEIMLFGKAGSSDRDWQNYMDQLTEAFKLRVLGTGCHTKIPTPGRSEEHDGWCSEYLLVPFFADSNS